MLHDKDGYIIDKNKNIIGGADISKVSDINKDIPISDTASSGSITPTQASTSTLPSSNIDTKEIDPWQSENEKNLAHYFASSQEEATRKGKEFKKNRK